MTSCMIKSSADHHSNWKDDQESNAYTSCSQKKSKPVYEGFKYIFR